MARTPRDTPWVFVSHASADLPKVRQIRNFMEEQNAAPILFHLKGLTAPEQFWPLIEQEIAARNFFFLCESEAARASPWVQREREAVERLSRQRPIRVGRVSLDDGEIDFAKIEQFLLNLHVYVVYPASVAGGDAFDILESFGYAPLGAIGFSPESLLALSQDRDARADVADMMFYGGASRGWLLVLLDNAIAANTHLRDLLPRLATRRIMFALIEKVTDRTLLDGVPPDQIAEFAGSFTDTVGLAARKMLAGPA